MTLVSWSKLLVDFGNLSPGFDLIVSHYVVFLNRLPVIAKRKTLKIETYQYLAFKLKSNIKYSPKVPENDQYITFKIF